MIRIYLAIVEFVQGQYEAALAEAEKADLLNPAYYLNYIAKGCCYRGLGDWVRAEIEFQKAFGLEEIAGHLVAWRMLGAMYQLRGQFKRAQEAMNKGLELAEKIGDKGWISDFHQSLARIFLGSDQPEKAFQELDKSLRPAIEIVSLTRQKNILSAKGFVELDLGKTREAQKTADALKALIDQDANKKAVRYLDLLAGRMMIDNKDYSGATDRLSKAEALLPFQYFFDNDQVIFMDALALAYFKQGDLDKARKECEKISQLTVGAFYYGDIFAKNFYRLGMICEKQGDKVKAGENYRKFLDLWKDADAGRPEVADAKKRLASL
jgi:tetratricopeptide (TPR) repeat protein